MLRFPLRIRRWERLAPPAPLYSWRATCEGCGYIGGVMNCPPEGRIPPALLDHNCALPGSPFELEVERWYPRVTAKGWGLVYDRERSRDGL